METNELEQLAKWDAGKEVNTKYGPRIIRKAEPTPEFSAAWKTRKDEIKTAGANWSKNERNGQWELVWFQQLPETVIAERAASVSASRAASADVDLPRPDGLNYLPFQRAGIQYALDRAGVLLADDMGLGKTIQAIGIINADETIRTAIIVCPKSLKLNWKNELEKWLVRPMSIGLVTDKTFPTTDIVILNYEQLLKFAVTEYVDGRPVITGLTGGAEKLWDISIVDEAHYIKSAKAKRSVAVKKIRARRAIRATGTPITNRPAELYNLISDFPGNWGTFFQFAKRYCAAHQNGFGWDFSGASNLDELQRRLRESCMVRRIKADVLRELPRKIRQIVELDADSASLRRAVSAETETEKRNDARMLPIRVAAELAKLNGQNTYDAAVQQLRDAEQLGFTEMSRVRHETAMAKVPAAVDFISGILEDNDNKILIGAHHHDVIDALTAGLLKFNPVVLTGRNNETERESAKNAFQMNPDVRVLIGSIQAAGVGLTLTAAAHVVFVELDWVPGNVSQFEDRVHRIGQLQTVLVQHLVVSGSIDARMAKSLVEKQNTIDSALDTNHPERVRSVFTPKERAASAGTTVDALDAAAAKLTAEDIETIHSRLRYLAGMDADRAAEINGIGFNKIDGRIGHSLAQMDTLTPRAAALGQKILKKYHGQFGE